MLTSVVAPGEGEGFASDEIAGVHHPISKMAFGAEGAAPMLVSEAAPLPITDNSAQTILAALLAKLVGPQNQWRCGFDKAKTNDVDTSFLSILQTGSGQTVNQTNGSLVITAGTTANAETIIRSNEAFDGDIVMRWSALLSQRIAQNNFYIELVDVIGDSLAYTINSTTSVTVTFPSVNPFTSENVGQSMWLGAITGAAGIPNRYAIASVVGLTVTFTVASWPASGSGTLSLFGWNYHQVVYQGTSATSVDFDAQRNGYASGVTTATINTTASTHVGTYAGGEGEVALMDQTGASSTGVETARRGSRVRNVPVNETQLRLQIRCRNGNGSVNETQLRLQIRCRNGTTNPATNTTFTVGVVDISNSTPMPVTIQNVSPMSANSALPVELLSSITQPVAVTAGTALMGDVQLRYRADNTGAGSGSHIVSAATTNATNMKASAGRLLGWSLANTTAVWQYVKLHNLASTPTAGSGVSRTIAIPPGGSRELSIEGGLAFGTGIGYTIVTGSADSDTTATTLGAVVGDLFWA